MKVQVEKIRRFAEFRGPTPATGELRRQEGVFWIDGTLPPRPTLETVFESDCMAPADLFCVTFTKAEEFTTGRELVALLKKNFSGFILGRFFTVPSAEILDGAYAAGIDLVDIRSGPGEWGSNSALLFSLDHARTVFPRWSVASTVRWEDGPPTALGIADQLLGRGILPLAEFSPSQERSLEEIGSFFQDLARKWRRAGVPLKPFRPLIEQTTPLAAPAPRRGLETLLDRVETAGMRTASDLRRLLRVRRMEASYESAGL